MKRAFKISLYAFIFLSLISIAHVSYAVEELPIEQSSSIQETANTVGSLQNHGRYLTVLGGSQCGTSYDFYLYGLAVAPDNEGVIDPFDIGNSNLVYRNMAEYSPLVIDMLSTASTTYPVYWAVMSCNDTGNSIAQLIWSPLEDSKGFYDINFGLAVIIVMMFLMVIGFAFNHMNSKKPWR